MVRERKSLVTALFLTVVWLRSGMAQAPIAILEIEVQNEVFYHYDTVDIARMAADQGFTTVPPHGAFPQSIGIADIVAVNGSPARGTCVFKVTDLSLNPNPGTRAAIADTIRLAAVDMTAEILQADGLPVGTIMMSGYFGGPRSPGAPSTSISGMSSASLTITGGLGAFLGARGQAGIVQSTFSGQQGEPSVAESPRNRRNRGGTLERYVVHLIPMFRPAIVASDSGPAVFHADFSQVTSAKPARGGELLILTATGLGPTRPGVDLGTPFPAVPLQIVNSPIVVTVNGRNTEAINQVGWPSLVDTYRVDFRLPEGTTAGLAAIQLRAAWIAGPEVKIPVQ